MEQISFVFQEVRLFKKRIRDNIRAARPDATEAEILHAAQLAQCSDILEKTPGGLDAVIGAKIAEAMDAVGKDGAISVEDSQTIGF